MSQVKGTVTILFKLDTEEYPVPADSNLSLQLKEDIQEAIESSVAIEINNINIKRTAIKNDEIRDFD